MDQSKQTKQADGSLAPVVAAQGAKLQHLTTEVESAFNGFGDLKTLGTIMCVDNCHYLQCRKLFALQVHLLL